MKYTYKNLAVDTGILLTGILGVYIFFRWFY